MYFNCPNCDVRLEIENDRSGEYLPCPACEAEVRVPKAPVIIRKGGSLQAPPPPPPPRRGMHLIPKSAEARGYLKGSLAERMAALKAAQLPQESLPQEDFPQEELTHL